MNMFMFIPSTFAYLCLCIYFNAELAVAGDRDVAIRSTGPRNVAILANTSVAFTCSAEDAQSIRWQHTAIGSSRPFIIYNGEKISAQASPELVDVINSASAGSSTLKIYGAQTSNGGSYACMGQVGVEHQHVFELTIIDADPTCDVAVGSTQNMDSIHLDDVIETRCYISFTGNLVPAIKCSPTTLDVSWVVNVTDRHAAFYSKVFASSLPNSGVTFQCTFTFRARDKSSVSTSPVGIAYANSFNWISRLIRVSDWDTHETERSTPDVVMRFMARKRAATATDGGGELKRIESQPVPYTTETIAPAYDAHSPSTPATDDGPVYSDAGYAHYEEVKDSGPPPAIAANMLPYEGPVGHVPVQPEPPSVYNRLAGGRIELTNGQSSPI